MILRIIGYGLAAGALGLVLLVLYRNSPQSNLPLLYSEEQTLAALWNQYKLYFLEPGTYRTVDRERDNVTTSEGQSYTMLRAVWMGDKPTFDTQWKWTQDNLARQGDNLFAWIWGKRPDGSFGVLTDINGHNSASDADTHIALSLIFAYVRWQDQEYLASARTILQDLWDLETITLGGRTYVLANNVEKFTASQRALINPSYLTPAAYRIFALVDPDRPWLSAVEGAYDAINASAELHAAHLPANWITIDKSTGAFAAPEAPGTDANFGYDALRVPWNLALDWAWFREPRAPATAEKFAHLSRTWESEGKLVATYLPGGEPAPNYDYETPSMYGGAIGYFMLADPENAREVYERKLSYLFTPDWSGWRQPLSYYDESWAWFGMGLYAGLLPNLAGDVSASFFTQPTS